MRAHLAVTCIAVGLVWLTACGDDEETGVTASGPTTSSTTTTGATSVASTTTTASTAGPGGMGTGGMGPGGQGGAGGATGGAGGTPSVCGNSQIEGSEACDDGNTAAGDGCSDLCAVESGWTCDMMSPTTCTTTCGDGLVAGTEACDDANTTTGDGCDAMCAVEDGWTCDMMSPTSCIPTCGDFVVLGSEQCDDGNAAAGDGCSATCTFEATCANGIVEPGETCDDGNSTALDGCDASCQLEAGTVCGDAIDLNDPTIVTVANGKTTYVGDTTGSLLVNFSNPGCSSGTTGVPTKLHSYTLQQPGSLLVETVAVTSSALTDTVIWAHTACQGPGPEIACDDDGGPSLYSLEVFPFLPAGTTVFILVSGYDSLDVGPYQLDITENPQLVLPPGSSCATPVAVEPGLVYHGVVASTDPNNLTLGCLFGTAGAPDAVYELSLATKSNVTITAQGSPPASYDLAVGLLDSSCDPMVGELGCADNTASGLEVLQIDGLNPGTYYIAIDGSDAVDFGGFNLSVTALEVVPLSSPCDPTEQLNVCEPGLACTGPTGSEVCTTPLFLEEFTTGLGAMVVTDYLTDGETWKWCDPATMSCLGSESDTNTTGSDSGGPYAAAYDPSSTFVLDGELLTSPQISATGLTNVFLAFDHNYDDFSSCTDSANVEVSLDGMAWTLVNGYSGADASGHAVFDISSTAAGNMFYVRFRYDDSATTTTCFAEEWRLDDVIVYGY